MSSDSMKDIILDISECWIVVDQRIKTRDEWVAGVNFIHEDSCEEAHSVNEYVTQIKFLNI